MNVQQLLEKVVQMPRGSTTVPVAPPLELVALIVRWGRRMRDWKVSTLADFACVSISTVERVERGERVGEESLDRIAHALGYDKGAFHVPRVSLDPTKTAEQLAETMENLVQVPVSVMRTQRALREAMACQAFMVHRPDVPAVYDDDISNLVEWLDFAAFSVSGEIRIDDEEEPSRRSLYADILKCVAQLERRGLTVISGVMHAPQPGFPDWRVALISITPRLNDPGASKRTHVLIDRRNVVLSKMEYGDIGSIIRGS